MPQLNPEFFISQLFWLVITFSFLFVFLWRISLPRIENVLEKRANKINENIKTAKKYQTEAEEIQTKIDSQLREAKLETSELIKKANINLQDLTSKKLEKIDEAINLKLNDASSTIEKSKVDSLKEINNQIYDITKLTLSKISNIIADDNEIKKMVKILQDNRVND